jgi:hypothetical protein
MRRARGSVPRALEERAAEMQAPNFSNELLLGEGEIRTAKKLTRWERDEYIGVGFSACQL